MAAEHLDLPRWDPSATSAEDVRVSIDSWVRSAALDRLIHVFGGRRPAYGRTAELVDWIDHFSATHWDFRAGSERDSARSTVVGHDQDLAVRETAVSLGLAGRETPPRRCYDAVLMTGGMVRAGIVKPRFVAGLLASGLVTSHVVFLGAYRTFSQAEAILARSLEVEGRDEVDAMVSGMVRTFSPLSPARVQGSVDAALWASWGETTWASTDLPSTPQFSVVAAPSTAPERRRADTADTFRFWAGRRDPDVRSVLVVTTPVYVPYQAAVAVETLGVEHGLAVDTVGVDAAANDLGVFTQPFTTAHHLQELRSAVRGFRSLLHALDERDRRAGSGCPSVVT